MPKKQPKKAHPKVKTTTTNKKSSSKNSLPTSKQVTSPLQGQITKKKKLRHRKFDLLVTHVTHVNYDRIALLASTIQELANQGKLLTDDTENYYVISDNLLDDFIAALTSEVQSGKEEADSELARKKELLARWRAKEASTIESSSRWITNVKRGGLVLTSGQDITIEGLRGNITRVDIEALSKIHPIIIPQDKPPRKINCSLLVDAKRNAIGKRTETLTILKEDIFAELSAIDKTFQTEYIAAEKVNKNDRVKELYKFLYRFLTGQGVKKKDRGSQSYIFKDPDDSDFIWLYGGLPGIAEGLNNKFKDLLQQKTKPGMFTEKFQQEFLVCKYIDNGKNKPGLFKINLTLLKHYKKFIYEPEILRQLRQVDACPETLCELIRDLKRTSRVKSKYILSYKHYKIFKDLVETIQDNGYRYGEDYYFLSVERMEGLTEKLLELLQVMRGSSCYMSHVNKIINDTLKTEKEHYISDCKKFRGKLIDKAALEKVLTICGYAFPKMDLRRLPKLHLEGYIDAHEIRKPARRKGHPQQKFMRLDIPEGVEFDPLPTHGMVLRPKVNIPKHPKSKTHVVSQQPVAQVPRPVASKPASKAPFLASMQVSPVPHSRNNDISDVIETVPDPIAFDLENPSHLELLEQRCGREIIVTTEDHNLSKLRIIKDPNLDFSKELGELSRPYALVVTGDPKTGEAVFKTGEAILDYHGKIISKKEADNLKNCVVLMQTPDGQCTIGNGPSTFGNHSSSSPNAKYVHNEIRGVVELLALCPIYPGQQILLDYGDPYFLECDKEHLVEVDARKRREVFLNRECSSQSLDDLLQKNQYNPLKFDDALLISHYFYGNYTYALSGTELTAAIIKGDADGVSRLLTQKPQLLHLPLIRIEKGRAVQKAAPKEEQNAVYPLALAAYLGNTEVVAALLANARIDVNIRCMGDGRMPLNAALASRNNVEMVKILLNAGASPVLQDVKDYTLLHYCVEQNLVDIARDIIEHHCLPEGNDVLQLSSYISKTKLDYITLAVQHNRLDFLEDFLHNYPEEAKPSKKKKRGKSIQREVQPADKLFYYVKDVDAENLSALSETQVCNLLNQLQDPHRFFQWLDAYPYAFYPPFIKLAKSLLCISPEVKECLEEGDRFSNYANREIQELSPCEYMRKAVRAYRNAQQLATNNYEKQRIQTKLDESEPIAFDLAIHQHYKVYIESLQDALKGDFQLYECVAEFKKFLSDNHQQVIAKQPYIFINGFFERTQELIDNVGGFPKANAIPAIVLQLKKMIEPASNHMEQREAGVKKRKADDVDGMCIESGVATKRPREEGSTANPYGLFSGKKKRNDLEKDPSLEPAKKKPKTGLKRLYQKKGNPASSSLHP